MTSMKADLTSGLCGTSSRPVTSTWAGLNPEPLQKKAQASEPWQNSPKGATPTRAGLSQQTAWEQAWVSLLCRTEPEPATFERAGPRWWHPQEQDKASDLCGSRPKWPQGLQNDLWEYWETSRKYKVILAWLEPWLQNCHKKQTSKSWID